MPERIHFKCVEPHYEMEKNGQPAGGGDKDMEVQPFLENQRVNAGKMLGDIWYPPFLRGQRTIISKPNSSMASPQFRG
jgi:hypothetical protein